MIPAEFVSIVSHAYEHEHLTREEFLENLAWYRMINEKLLLAHENVMHKALVSLDEFAINALQSGESMIPITDVRNVVVAAMRKYTPTVHMVG